MNTKYVKRVNINLELLATFMLTSIVETILYTTFLYETLL